MLSRSVTPAAVAFGEPVSQSEAVSASETKSTAAPAVTNPPAPANAPAGLDSQKEYTSVDSTSVESTPVDSTPVDSVLVNSHSADSSAENFAGMGPPSRAGEQRILALLCLLLLVWAGWRWLELSRWGSQQIEVERLPAVEWAYVVDLNTANWLELALLEGVGEVLGKRIVESRETDGPFQSVDELTRVKGIGLKTLEKLRPQVYVTPPE